MIQPVIISGGSGTRLWPLSRKLYPKQFLSFVSENSLFQDTILRLPSYTNPPLIICNEEHRFIVAEQLRQISSQNKGVILEPEGKNTAPAIALAAFNSINNNEDPILLVLSADHLITDLNKFHEIIKIGEEISNQGKLVAIGSKPTRAETGYGYIKARNTNQNASSYVIDSFSEKPSKSDAEQFLVSGNYFWNSGIFMFKASSYLKELREFEPEIYECCKKSSIDTSRDMDFIRIDREKFLLCPDKSIDYAVMENTKDGIVVPFYGSWSDIGSWEALWEAKEKDNNNNVTEGDVIIENVKNSFIHSSNRIVSVNDVNNLIIIDTQDALLVSNKNKSQEIKKIVSELELDKRNEVKNNRKVFRPWGYFDSIDSDEGFQVKRILVNPGAKISLQKHKMRSEHWVVVKGKAIITCGEETFELNKNQSTYIPRNQVHRLENQEETPLEIIEIQTGTYLGEDDIVRLEDDYMRD